MLTNSTVTDSVGDAYCINCDTWLGLPGFHVTDVAQGGDGLYVSVETSDCPPPACLKCGSATHGHGRIPVTVYERPSTNDKTVLTWRKRRYRCQDCHVTSTEPHPISVRQKHQKSCQQVLTGRAVDWAINQLRHEHASINGLARQLGCDWHTPSGHRSKHA